MLRTEKHSLRPDHSAEKGGCHRSYRPRADRVPGASLSARRHWAAPSPECRYVPFSSVGAPSTCAPCWTRLRRSELRGRRAIAVPIGHDTSRTWLWFQLSAHLASGIYILLSLHQPRRQIIRPKHVYMFLLQRPSYTRANITLLSSSSNLITSQPQWPTVVHPTA